MGRRNRECYLCGQGYLYCPTCSQDRTKPSWMSEFHKESCKNIFDICTRFNMGMMSKIEAQEALKSCDLSNRENFKPFVKRDLDVIFAEEPKKRGKRIEIKPIDEAIVEPVVINIIKEQQEEVAPQHEVVLKEEE